MKVVEWVETVQGEFPNMGEPCILIRFKECNLDCDYCDAEKMKDEPVMMSVPDIMEKLQESKPIKQVLLTGGEPLMEPELNQLLAALNAADYTIVIETNGSMDLGMITADCQFAMDVKLSPKYAMAQAAKNLRHLRDGDACKFIIGNDDEFKRALSFIESNFIYPVWFEVVFSPRGGYHLPVHELIEFGKQHHLLPWKLQVQIHKFLGVA